MHLKNVYRPLAGVGLLLMSGCYAPYGGYPPGAYAPQGGAPMQYQGVPQSSYVMPGDAMGSPSSIGSGAPATFAPGGNLQAPNPTAREASGGSPSPVPPPRDPDPSAAKPTGEQTSQFGSPSGPPNVSLGAPAELDFQSPIIFAGASIPSHRVHRLVHPVDVAPTLSALLGMTAPGSSRGTILTEVLSVTDDK